MSEEVPEPASVYLVRHGETAWSLSGQHTGHTDIALTTNGEAQARALEPTLRDVPLARVFSSPLQRARRTAELAGVGADLSIEPDLIEWNYGEYDGLRLDEIRRRQPGWMIYRDGCPGGEAPADVAARADRLIARLRSQPGPIAVFTHGHFGRVLGTRWIGLPLTAAQGLWLDTASLSLLGYDHHAGQLPAIRLWNAVPQRR
jgi:probable phosphoglycerate mutase